MALYPDVDDAWTRVVEGIEAAIERIDKVGTQTIPPQHLHGIAVRGVNPAASNFMAHQLRSPPADYIGRIEELAEMRGAIAGGSITAAGIFGRGGIGKTALALKLAQELSSSYLDGQFDIDLRGASSQPLAPSAVMSQVVRTFKPDEEPQENDAALAVQYREALRGKRVLLLLDDARDLQQVEPLLPPTGCLVLVTSRHYFTLPGIYVRRLDALRRDQAVTLVRSIVPRIGAALAAEIAVICACVPLALKSAACTLAVRRDLDPVKYLDQLRRPEERAKLVEHTLSLSVDMLGVSERRFWLRLGVFPGDFDLAAAVAVGNVTRPIAEELVGDFVRRSLLDYDVVADRYRLHELAIEYARSRLDPDERMTSERLHAQHFCVLAGEAEEYRRANESSSAGFAVFDREWINIRSAQAWAAYHAPNDPVAEIICCLIPLACAGCLTARQRHHELSWSTAGLASAVRLGRRTDEYSHVYSIGHVHLRLRNYEMAAELFARAADIAQKLNNKTGECSALTCLGSARASAGDQSEARGVLRRALRIARQAGDQYYECRALNELGLLCMLENPMHATRILLRALRVAQQGNLGSIENWTYRNVGIASAALGNVRYAMNLYEEAVAHARTRGTRKAEACAHWGLASLYELAGDLSRAIAEMDECVKILRDLSDPDVERDEAHIHQLRAKLTRRVQKFE